MMHKTLKIKENLACGYSFGSTQRELSNEYQHSNVYMAGHDVNFCSDLPGRASEIQFSLGLLQLSLALEKLYIIIL